MKKLISSLSIVLQVVFLNAFSSFASNPCIFPWLFETKYVRRMLNMQMMSYPRGWWSVAFCIMLSSTIGISCTIAFLNISFDKSSLNLRFFRSRIVQNIHFISQGTSLNCRWMTKVRISSLHTLATAAHPSLLFCSNWPRLANVVALSPPRVCTPWPRTINNT